MIPARFVFEYPKRCLDLIEAMEIEARRRKLVGSFSLMVAPSLFLIPYERMDKKHPLREREREPDLYRALHRIKNTNFLQAAFWKSAPAGDWRVARVVTPINKTGE